MFRLKINEKKKFLKIEAARKDQILLISIVSTHMEMKAVTTWNQRGNHEARQRDHTKILLLIWKVLCEG